MKRSFLVILLLILVACAEMTRPEQLDRLRNLQKELSDIREDFEAIDSTQILTMQMDFDSLVQAINESRADSITLELAFKLDQFRIMNKDASFVSEQCMSIMGIINEREEQLQKLERDITESLGHREKYDTYLDFEQAQVSKLKHRIDTCVLRMNNSLEIYNELNQIIVQEVLDLKKENLTSNE